MTVHCCVLCDATQGSLSLGISNITLFFASEVWCIADVSSVSPSSEQYYSGFSKSNEIKQQTSVCLLCLLWAATVTSHLAFLNLFTSASNNSINQPELAYYSTNITTTTTTAIVYNITTVSFNRKFNMN